MEQESQLTNSQNVYHEEIKDLGEHMANVVIFKANRTYLNDDEEREEVPQSHFLDLIGHAQLWRQWSNLEILKNPF